MKKLLLTSFLIVPASVYAQRCQAPPAAKAAGYNTLTFGGTPVAGQNVTAVDARAGTTQTSAGMTIAAPTNNNYNYQAISNAAIGGGAYIQATMQATGPVTTNGGWPSFWLTDAPGQRNPNESVEIDIAEVYGGKYGSAMHDWIGPPGTSTKVDTNLPQVAVDITKPTTFGLLLKDGLAQFYLNGQPSGPPVTWNAGDHFSLANSSHYSLVFGTGETPITFTNFQVWQSSTANDIGLSAPSIIGSPCGDGSVANPASVPLPSAIPPAIPPAAEIVPGQGSIADASGNSWSVSDSGNVMVGDQAVPGGGDTAAIEVVNGVVWGLDNGKGPICPGCWFTLDGQNWTPKPGQSPSASTEASAQSPDAVQQCQANGPATGIFHVAGGQIIGPNGKPWIARGLNLYDDQLDQAGAMTGSFPGLDFVRVNIHSYQNPSAYQSFVTEMTSAGRVVEFEDHPDGGGGQDAGPPKGIAAELSWYAAMAKAYAGNPYVWFGTFNEPMATPGLSAWQRSTYDAIRGAGNKNPILLEISGYPGNWTNSLDPSVYATMTNTIWDPHFYGWIPRYSTDQTTVDQALADELAGIQQIRSADGTMPVLVGEYGDSTDGTNVDANGIQVVTSVINGVTQKNVPGAIAWAYDPGGNADHVTNGGQVTHPYGDMMRLFIGNDVVQPTQCQVTAQAHQLINTLTAQIAATPTGATDAATAPETRSQSSAIDPSIASDVAQADALVSQAQAILKGIPTQ